MLQLLNTEGSSVGSLSEGAGFLAVSAVALDRLWGYRCWLSVACCRDGDGALQAGQAGFMVGSLVLGLHGGVDLGLGLTRRDGKSPWYVDCM